VTLAALVLAAGRGERLRPLTDATPKPLLTVGSRTLLDRALDLITTAVTVSPRTVTVNAHWLAEQIVAHVGRRVHVSVEHTEALGTAGAVGAIRGWLGDRDLLIANGDVFFDGDIDLPAFVAGWDGARPRLLVVEDAERADFDGRWRFAGVSLLPAVLAQALPAEPSGLYEKVWRDAEVDLVPTAATFIDCGTPEDLARARALAGDRTATNR
jgi:MurNAc alpha-1-phosphate uridylyltransferase